jgi:hypothetical protein
LAWSSALTRRSKRCIAHVCQLHRLGTRVQKVQPNLHFRRFSDLLTPMTSTQKFQNRTFSSSSQDLSNGIWLMLPSATVQEIKCEQPSVSPKEPLYIKWLRHLINRQWQHRQVANAMEARATIAIKLHRAKIVFSKSNEKKRS